MDQLEDLQAIRTASGAGQQIPKKLIHSHEAEGIVTWLAFLRSVTEVPRIRPDSGGILVNA
jgi:hypothetical protein